MTTDIDVMALRGWEKQPRKRFEKGPQKELEDSIRALGVLQPLVVRALPPLVVRAEPGEVECYEIIAGERRWRAAKGVGLQTVPCVVRELTDRQAIEIAVSENEARADLDVVERAQGYQTMVELGWSVGEIVERCGRSKQSIYLLLELLKLDEETLADLRAGMLSMNTAKALGSIENEAKRKEARERVTRPTSQVGSLPEKAAMALISGDFLEPQRRRVTWEKNRRVHEKTWPGARVAEYEESHELLGPGTEWVDVLKKPESWELAVHAREWEIIPTWGELGERHGSPRVVCADGRGEPVCLVKKGPIRTAELVRGEEFPTECLFPLPGGEGRHAQTLEKVQKSAATERETAEQQKTAELEAKTRQVETLKALQRWLTHPMESVALADLEEELGRVMGVLKDEFVSTDEVLEALGIDAEALGDGDAEKGAEVWRETQVETRGFRGLLFLWLSDVLMSYAPGSRQVWEMAALVPKK